MSIIEYIISAGRCLGANKFRTFLTTLGIIVGISSVIFITTLGNTLGKTITNVIYAMYSGNKAYIHFLPEDEEEAEYDDNGRLIIPDNLVMTSDMLNSYSEQFGDKVKKIVTSQTADQTLGRITVTDERYSDITVAPVSEGTKNMYMLKMLDGRFVTTNDENNCAATAVISDVTARCCFGEDSPIGKQISVNTADGYSMPCVVVGVYQYINFNSITPDDERQTVTDIYIPCTFYNKQRGIYEEDVKEIYYSINNIDDINEFKQETADFFDSYIAGSGWKTDVYLLTDDMSKIDSVVNILTLVISAIAAVALFVGGIGVMNIMLVSVTERTMEIGVRKAMGASNKSIKIQFLTESIIISLLGAILGIVWGIIQTKIVALIAVRVARGYNFELSVDLSVPYAAILAAVGFSFLIGICFGVYPANKAAKMELVDALRYE